MHEAIRDAITTAVTTLGFPPSGFVVEYPADLSHGDFSSNVALVLAKRAGLLPRECAERIVRTLKVPEGISAVTIADPGFINFTLAGDVFVQMLGAIGASDRWGINQSGIHKKIILEYTDPNPFKALHIGHVMSNAIGESLARLMEYTGAEVKRANYQGDVGKHVACAVWSLLQSPDMLARLTQLDLPRAAAMLGEHYANGVRMSSQNPTVAQEVAAINRSIYLKEEGTILDAYLVGRTISLNYFQTIYNLLGTAFDFFFFESETGPYGATLVRAHIDDGVFEESEGAVVYRGEKEGLHTRVFITAEGFPTYEAKELGLAHIKYETYPHEESYIITANEVNEYFNVLLAAMRRVVPDIAAKTHHIGHGMMRLTSGKMSSRTGNVISGEDLINTMRHLTLQKMRSRELSENERHVIADMVAVAAIKYMVLRQGTGKNIVFDPEASLSFEGDSGPYLQYAHARACSVLAKAAREGIAPDASTPPAAPTPLERLLYRFPDTVLRAQREREPHHITSYLTEIAGAFNAWYAATPIVDTNDKTSPYKIMLTRAFATTMKNGLYLLGIKAPERM